MQLKPDSVISSVVVRMRLGWLAIVVLLGSVVVASVLGFKNVQSTQRTLVEQAIPALDLFETVSDELASLEQRVATLQQAETAASLEKEASMAAASLARLDALLSAQPDLQETLAGMEMALTSLVAVGERKLENRNKTTQLAAQANDLGLHLSDIISRQVEKDGIQLETLILAGAETNPEHLNLKLSELNALTELGSKLSFIADKMEALTSTGSLIRIEELEGRLAFEFRGMVRDLVLLPQSPLRQDLARAVSQLREILLDEAGLVASQKARLQIAETQAFAQQRMQELFDQTSAIVGTNVLGARSGIVEAANRIETRIAKTSFQLYVLSGVIALAISLATVFLIERQIIRRLRILTRSVREIAAGNNDWQVSVHGADEFGEMASALEVFKGNSKELRRSNEELGRFAYAASHDLKSPLRAIHDLASWTIEDAGDALPADCLQNLQLMQDRASRLSNLLDSLLAYSEAGQGTSKVESVDLDWVPRDILDLLGAPTGFTIKTEGDLGTVNTYEAPFRQVLHNFINNAIKHHDRDSGEIIVSYQRNAGSLTVSVTDDGPGITPAYHEKVFELFKTLRSRDEVEGSGMGLAIIRKQVEQHGGTVSVISDPAQRRGTTFVFDWPLIEEQNVIDFAA